MMSWKEFKEKVDSELKSRAIREDECEINWIDFHEKEAEEIDVTVTSGSDGRLEVSIT